MKWLLIIVALVVLGVWIVFISRRTAKRNNTRWARKAEMNWYELRENEREEFVYHYTKWETLVEFILPSGELRIGPFAKTNDTYDFKHWDIGGRGVGRPEELKQIPKPQVPFMRLKKRCNLVAFSCDSSDGALKDINHRGFGILPMWSHYADSFRGCCLVFNRQMLKEVIETDLAEQALQNYYGKVEYKLPKPSHEAYAADVNKIKEMGMDSYLETHLDLYNQELLFSKHESWSYEREYRIVVIGKKPGELFVNIKEALCGIVLGYSCPLPDNVIKSFSEYNLDLRRQYFDYQLQSVL